MFGGAYSLIRNWSAEGSEYRDSFHSRSLTVLVLVLELAAGPALNCGRTVAVIGTLAATCSGAPIRIGSRGKQDTSKALLGRPRVVELAANKYTGRHDVGERDRERDLLRDFSYSSFDLLREREREPRSDLGLDLLFDLDFLPFERERDRPLLRDLDLDKKSQIFLNTLPEHKSIL
ncbi:hypothetical protein CB1_002228002 [Camelus ferus]|nr:hypothetical protein CB1_002228002 [Camelus ferus]